MKVLVTGAKGFIGQNLVAELKNQQELNILEQNRATSKKLLEKFCQEADFVYHLAGVSRPLDKSEFKKSNYDLTFELLNFLRNANNNCPIMFASSVQASLDNPYGRSKKDSENLIFDYSFETGAKAFVYRLPNVFGKWSKPNHNSVIATFCYNVNNDLPLTVKDENVRVKLVYIDDLLMELLHCLNGKENRNGRFCEVVLVYSVTLKEIVDLIYAFKNSRLDLIIPNMKNDFIKKLYSTYQSFIPEEHFSYRLNMNIDDRGSFTEFIKSHYSGQVSVNVTKPGILKGNHWHHTKSEKFLVVKGKGIIRLRKLHSAKITEILASGEKLEVVDIPPGYVHNIENVGNEDLVTVMWAGESFCPENPDTSRQDV